MRKGLLELAVLLVIGSNDKVYTNEILSKLEASELLVVEGTLYPLLGRLKDEGLVLYAWEESPHGPPRKYYSLTEHGKNSIKAMRTEWQKLTQSISTLEQAYDQHR